MLKTNLVKRQSQRLEVMRITRSDIEYNGFVTPGFQEARNSRYSGRHPISSVGSHARSAWQANL